MTRLPWFLLLLATVSTPAAAQPIPPFGQYGKTGHALYTEQVTHSLYLPMRDGVRLAISITRPARNGQPVEGRFPVIWTHTLAIAAPGAGEQADGVSTITGSYSTTQARGVGAMATLTAHGYVEAEVARRGMGPSFGTRRGYNDRSEAYDAYEIIEWLATQSWSTGDVGVFGCSNTGDAAMHAVTAGNPHLKAAWAGCFSWEKYDGFLRGGIFANWGTGAERTAQQDLANTPVEGDEAKLLLSRAAEEHQGATVLADLWKSMPFRDSWSPLVQSRFWYEGSVASYAAQINRSGTAIYVQAGWQDDFRQQGLVAFANLTVPKHLLIGPWTHCGNGDFDMLGEAQRFFDFHLKGIDSGIQNDAPIHYFTSGAPDGQQWRASRQWPPAGTQPRKFYLAAGTLAASAPASLPAPTSFTVRYDVDCPTAGGGRPMVGPQPCAPEQAGPHFVSPELTADTEITGSAVADFWIAATTSDANLFVYLEDVAPGGGARVITEGRLKASLRKLAEPPYNAYGLPWHPSRLEDAEPLQPGEPARLVFDLLPASHIFARGHRIRISLAGADFRQRDRAPVVPAPVITLQQSGQWPSTVTLPLIASGAAR